MTAKYLLMNLYFFLHERKYKKVRYLFQKNHSKTLAIVFSGLPARGKPVYNYVMTLKNYKADKLFVLDDFAYPGGCYMYANGSDWPMVMVLEFLNRMIKKGKYSRVITLGSSKGGTCSLYFGLALGVNDIYSGAPAYHLGAYLNKEWHMPMFQSMMGKNAGKKEQEVLDALIPDLVEKKSGCDTVVHLMFSKKEHMYRDHIADMIVDMDRYGIKHEDWIMDFSKHGEVGKFFVPWIKERLQVK